MTTRPALLRLPMAIPLLAGIFLILLVGSMRLASPLLVPIAIAVIFTLLLRPVVRAMKSRGVPEGVGAAVVVFGALGILGVSASFLAGPTADWIRRAPTELGRVEVRIRKLVRPFIAIRQSAERVEAATGGPADARSVQIQSPGPLRGIGWTTASAIGSMLTVVFLTYFLLATGAVFRRKVAHLLGADEHRDKMEEAMTEIELQISRYLLYNTLISLAVGTATFALLTAIGLPNALLWGVCAFILNYIPYLGGVVTVIIIALAALVSFEGLDKVLLACGGFVVINVLEAYWLTPTVLGRKLPLNSVAIFVALLFWSWVWGIAGAIMAVPLTVMIQVFCSHVKRLHPVAVLLDS